MRARAVVIAVVAVACGHWLLAQQDAPLPTFRTSVEAVQFDAVVTDADGNLVTDLTVDDFEIFENGVPQTITAFSLIDIPLDPPRGAVETWPVPADVLTNDGPEGRVYLFAFDPLSAATGLRLRPLMRRFLEDHFRPNDLGAVVLLGRGLVTSGQDFTSDPRLLLAAAEQFHGGRLGEKPQDMLESLKHQTQLLAQMPGGRKALIYFTSGPPLDAYDVENLRIDPWRLRFGSNDELDMLSAATRGSINIYTINPAGLTGDLESLETRMDMQALANVTGGFHLTDSNNFAAAFNRIVREQSTYYILGFESSYTARDGRYLRVEVRVKRPGLQVRARDGYLAPAGRPPAARAAGATASPAIDALEQPVLTRGIPIRVFAAPYKSERARDAAVALVIEIDAAMLDFVERDGGASADVEVTYLATDARKQAYPGGRHTISLAVPGDAPAWRSTVRLASQLALPEGRYQLRVGAGSGTQAGSVVYDLHVPDFSREPLMLSGLAITSTIAGGVQTFRPPPAREADVRRLRCNPPSCVVPLVDGAPGREDPLRDALPGPATTAREFDRADTITVYAEVYANLPRGTPAHTIRFTTGLQGENGAVLPMTSETRASSGTRRPAGGYGFTATIPLEEVPPGSYVLIVEGHSDAAKAPAVSRAVPIVVQ